MQLNVGPFQNYLSIVCLDLDMQDYLNAGISMQEFRSPSAVQSAVLPGVLRIGARPGKFAVFTLKIRATWPQTSGKGFWNPLGARN